MEMKRSLREWGLRGEVIILFPPGCTCAACGGGLPESPELREESSRPGDPKWHGNNQDGGK